MKPLNLTSWVVGGGSGIALLRQLLIVVCSLGLLLFTMVCKSVILMAPPIDLCVWSMLSVSEVRRYVG